LRGEGALTSPMNLKDLPDEGFPRSTNKKRKKSRKERGLLQVTIKNRSKKAGIQYFAICHGGKRGGYKETVQALRGMLDREKGENFAGLEKGDLNPLSRSA